MSSTQIFNLKCLALHIVKKNRRILNTQNLPSFFQKSFNDIHFFSEEKVRNARTLRHFDMVIQLQKLLEIPSVVTGGFASYMCNVTDHFRNVDIFAITSLESNEMQKIESTLRKNFPFSMVLCENFYFNKIFYPRITCSPYEPYEYYTIHFCLVPPEEISFFRQNKIAFAQRIVKDFDLEICKYVGFPWKTNDMMFFSFAEEEFFSYTDYNICDQFCSFYSTDDFLHLIKNCGEINPKIWKKHFFEEGCLRFSVLANFIKRLCKYFDRKKRENIPINFQILQTFLK